MILIQRALAVYNLSWASECYIFSAYYNKVLVSSSKHYEKILPPTAISTDRNGDNIFWGSFSAQIAAAGVFCSLSFYVTGYGNNIINYEKWKIICILP